MPDWVFDPYMDIEHVGEESDPTEIFWTIFLGIFLKKMANLWQFLIFTPQISGASDWKW